MTRLLIIIFVIVVPCLSLAQQVAVRSGEHGEFTRLAFDVPAGTNWEIAPSPDRSELRLILKMELAEFNIEGVFEKISKTRISDLKRVPGQAAVDIKLACECEFDAFAFLDRMIVVDIREELIEEIEESKPRVASNGNTSLRAGAVPNNQSDLAKIWLGPVARIGPRKPTISDVFGISFSNKVNGSSEIDRENSADRSQATEVREQIFGDVANAATQGLLTPTRSLARPPRNTDRRPLEQTDLPEEGLLEGAILDRSLEDKGRISIGGRQCVPDIVLGFTKWEEDAIDVNLLLANRRGAIYGEFDKLNRSVVDSYAKTLLYFSFGAEAREALMMIDSPEKKVLRALSFLVDGDLDPSHLFRNQLSCEGLAVVWAVVDGTGLSPSSEIAKASMVRGFEMLPKHLREHLGPVIAQNLIDNGFVQLAKEILRRLERMMGEETQSIAFGKAQIDHLNGNIQQASDAFNALAEAQSPETANAIAATVEISEQAGTLVSNRIVELSAAYSTELRNTEMGPELWEAHLKSLVGNGRFDDAFEILESVSGVDPSLIDDARNDVFRAVFDKADDLSFLKYYFQTVPEIWTALNDTVKLSAARRVTNLGLPSAALEVLHAISDPQLEHEKRYLHAKALFDLSRPEEAEILLIGLQGQEVSQLRALARSRMGDHDYARSIFSELGQESEAYEEAWLSGDWAQVSKTDGGRFSSAASMFQLETETQALDITSLAGVETLFRESSKSREAIGDILKATQVERFEAPQDF